MIRMICVLSLVSISFMARAEALPAPEAPSASMFLQSLAETPLAQETIDLEQLEQQMKTTGIQGWIHGSTTALNLYVFTYRHPKNFFVNVQFPLIGKTPALQTQIAALARHDKVLIKGEYLQIPAPQKHVEVQEITLVEQYVSKHPIGAYPYEANMPADVMNQKEMIAKVHIVVNKGKVLVLEYKDAVLPVPVSDEKLAKLASSLFRGDKIRLHYVVQSFTSQPVHIVPDSSVAEPIEVLNRIEAMHGQKATLTGVLLLFPKSPEITLDVYALQTVDADGVTLNYTLVNFENNEVFAAIREKLAGFWNGQPTGIENGRNCLRNPNIKLRVSGTINEVDPGQANPQILLDSPDSIELL